MMNTPIAFIIFNRPETTERVFAEIAKVKPAKLFLIADGPRADRPGEAEKCAAVRAIVDRVDWDCEVLKNYSDINLGCGQRPASGISWVFEHVEEAIILEDDCLPRPTFFRFCEALLAKYHNDNRVMMIGGRNNYAGKVQTPYSYYFCRRHSCWGWATWRRAWQYFDIKIKPWPDLRDTTWLRNILEAPEAIAFWRHCFDKAYAGAGNVDYWDYQWTFAVWLQNGLAILPKANLIHNIGFGEHATHTKSLKDRRCSLPTAEIAFPLQHPPSVVWNKENDRLLITEEILPKTQWQPNRYWRLCQRLASVLPRPLHKQLSNLRTQYRSSSKCPLYSPGDLKTTEVCSHGAKHYDLYGLWTSNDNYCSCLCCRTRRENPSHGTSPSTRL